MKNARISALCLTASLYLVAPTSVRAADTAVAAGQEQIEQVVVTARRVAERLQDVPISITVFNQQQLDAHNVANSADLAKYTPSLSVITGFNTDRATFAIRGFDQVTGTDPAVGTFFADVPALRSATTLIPGGDGAGPGFFFDLANVQVLKGPQGTLFGINTTGGDVMLVPQKPTNELGGYIQGGLGNYNYHEAEGVLNVPVNDNLQLRFGIQHKDRDGYLTNLSGIGPENFNDLNYTAVRASAVWDLTNNLENYTIFSYVNSDRTGDAFVLTAASANPALGFFGILFGAPGLAQLDYDKAHNFGFYDFQQNATSARSALREWQIINRTTWMQSDNLTIENIASYGQLWSIYIAASGQNLNTSNIPAFLGVPGGYPFFFFSTSNPTNLPTSNQDTLTDEFRLSGEALDNQLKWQAGSFSEFSNPLSVAGGEAAIVASCANTATFQCTDPLAAAFHVPVATVSKNVNRTWYRDEGLYAQGTYAITAELKLTSGFRYTWDSQKWDVTNINFAVPAAPAYGLGAPSCIAYTGHDANCSRQLSQSSSAPTWLVDLEYLPTSDYLFYAKYSRGYRAGVVNPAVVPPFTSVKPETLDAYEIGAKTSFDGVVPGSFDIAAFDNEFSNQQLQLNFNPLPGTGLPPTAAPINAGQSRTWGIEAGLHINPFEGFVLSADYTYLNARIVSIPNFAGQGAGLYNITSSFAAGQPIPLAPDNKYVLGATYTLPLPERIGKVSVGTTFVHTDRQFVAPANLFVPSPAIQSTAYLQATNLLDFDIEWQEIAGRPFDLTFFATNVTNQHYYTYTSGTGPDGIETQFVGAPAMFGARLRYNFASE
jgi:iron complex outermembrane receptor protein